MNTWNLRKQWVHKCDFNIVYHSISRMSLKTKEKEEFSFEKKKKMAAKISIMTNKDQLRKIRDIIFSENQNVSARKNNEGYLMYFQNYTNETYYKLEKYLNKIEKEKLEKQTRALTETSDQLLLSSEDPNTDYTLSRSRLRYSNTEKRLMKRRDYEKKINEPNDEIGKDLHESDQYQCDNTETLQVKTDTCDNKVKSEPFDQIKIKKTTRGQNQSSKLFQELPTIEEKKEKGKPIFSVSTSTKTKKN